MIDDVYGALRLGARKQSRGRTITETDVVHFCMLTGNWLGLHSDAEYAKTTRFGQRVVQGSLVFSIANALLPYDPEVVEAFYGADGLRFQQPTFIGDTLHARTEITALRDKGETSGVVTQRLEAVNQRGEVVMGCDYALLVRRVRLTNHGRGTA